MHMVTTITQSVKMKQIKHWNT